MAQFIMIDRNDVAEAEAENVEQPAVEIKVVELEQRQIGEAALVVSDDQLAIAMLYALIVGDRVVLKGP